MQPKTNLLYLNHASFLLRHDHSFLLTDPWFLKPAFGSWLSVPPMACHPVYLLALARSSREFGIVISHGHDDHCDDDLLRLFPKDTPVFVPKYPAPGTLQRIASIGFSRITEITPAGAHWGSFTFRSFYSKEMTPYDAIVSMEMPGALVVHANDNWRPLETQNIDSLCDLVSRYGRERSCYLSQCNIADSFPYSYPDFDLDEQKKMAEVRVTNQTRSSVTNAQLVGAKYFVNYAGHTKTIDRVNPHSLELTGYREHSFITSVARLSGIKEVEILDMVPGDSFDFCGVEKMFGVRIEDSALKEESVRFYEAYGAMATCDTYKLEAPSMSAPRVAAWLEDFLESFNSYIVERVDRANYKPEVMRDSVTISCPELAVAKTLKVGEGIKPGPLQKDHTVFEIPVRLLVPILRGEIGLDHILVGGQSKMRKTSKNYYNGNLIFWFGLFGWVYQKKYSAQFRERFESSAASK